MPPRISASARPKLPVAKITPPEVNVEELPNGARIVTHAVPGAKTMDMRIATLAGSWTEPAGKEGLAHLNEHLWFEGTPTNNASKIRREMSAMGDTFNAYTELGETVLLGEVNNRDAGRAARLLADMYAHPNHSRYRVEKERRAVQHEVRLKTGDMAGFAQRQLDQLAYGDDNIGNDGWGTPETVGAVKPSDLKKWAEANLTGRNTVAFLSGDPHKFPTDILRKQLGALPKGRTALEPDPSVEGFRPGAEAIVVPYEEDTQANVAISLPGQQGGGAAGLLAKDILSNRLFTNMREKQWLTYGVRSGGDHFSWEMHPRDLRKGVGELARSIRTMPASINADSLTVAKQRVMASLQQTATDPKAQAEEIFQGAMQRTPYAPDPTADLKAIAGVTVSDARAAARQIVDSLQNMKVAAWGALPDKPLEQINAGLKDARVDVQVQPATFDEQAWREAYALQPDPRDAATRKDGAADAAAAHRHQHSALELR